MRGGELCSPRQTLRHRGGSGLNGQRLQQPFALARGGLGVRQLDVAEAADLLRQRGERHQLRIVVCVEPGQQRAQVLLVLGEQRSFELALGAVAERVEQRAAQAAQARHHGECTHQPRAHFTLDGLARFGVGLGEGAAADVKVQLVVTLEGLFDFLAEARQRVQARHFPFVLGGQQLEVALRHGQAQRLLVLGLHVGALHFGDEILIALGVGGVLVFGQIGHAARDGLFEVRRGAARLELDHLGA